jgi:hypothetical protein
LEEHVSFIFGVEEYAKQETTMTEAEANYVVCENIGLFRNRRDLESQPIGSYLLCQRTRRRQEKID